jgi:uncharacterized protein (DUF1499 family)
MVFARWFTMNYANTTDPTHADLNPLRLPYHQQEFIEKLQVVVSRLPGWTVQSVDLLFGTAHLVRRSRFGAIDDVHVSCAEEGVGTRVDAESRSRGRILSLGRNRRNIRILWEAIRS